MSTVHFLLTIATMLVAMALCALGVIMTFAGDSNTAWNIVNIGKTLCFFSGVLFACWLILLNVEVKP